MKRLLLLSLLIFPIQLTFSQVVIDQNVAINDLIPNVLIGNPNFPASNYIVTGSNNFETIHSIGAFTSSNVDFPFEQGLVLSTGNILSVPGANTSIISEGSNSWPGDVDLEAATSMATTLNASSVSFDFIADVSEISLDFIFASEEYGGFECTFPDTFAFLITDLTTGITENIALVPNTNTAISILTVRGGDNAGCDAQNETYFERYNYVTTNTDIPHIDANNSPINFNGQTVPFVLVKDLVIGNPYNIKIVVGDASDTLYDSAIFVRNSSFGAYPVMEQEPSDLVVEDTNDDGVENFNLRMNESQMLGSVNTTIYSFDFSYHVTVEDAVSGVNSISNPEVYQNTSELENIYVRMANSYTGTAITNDFRITTDASLLSTSQFDLQNLKVYPNPVVDKLTIESGGAIIQNLAIYNISGQRVYEQLNKNSNSILIDFSSYSKGTYFLKLETEAGSVFKRIVK
ncbi:choice-of-anchor L domain-containing protein [Pontimicrobium sp. IMCC45349]|uniref:choice-of-anchor L domain-containing protein n=1 Tax=Pontimicrobium sp. IMCC45349 TaxID=3391574 RepID=UPI00399F28F6